MLGSVTVDAHQGGTAVGVYIASPRPAITWPHQVGVLPRQADCFQRRSAIEQLEQAVANGNTAIVCHVLGGMGGVGKTQLAAHYARTLQRTGQLDLAVWITAATRDEIVSGYAQAAAAVLHADAMDSERAARTFLAWLEPKGSSGPCRWLVVLDDLADLSDLRGLWPPPGPDGRTVITTRRREAALTGAGRRFVPVGLFTEEESAAYLASWLSAHGRHEPTEDLRALAAALGQLPLALSQAAAYVINADVDCRTYLALLGGAPALAQVLPDSSALPDDQTATVAATWALSIDRADHLSPAGVARPMLQLVAMLDPNGIPAAVLLSPPALAWLTERRAGVSAAGEQASPVSAQDAVAALWSLHRLSLIDHTPRTSDQAVRVHQLVQRAARDDLTGDEHRRTARIAAEALLAAWPVVERDTGLGRVLRANADALIRIAEDALWESGTAHALLFRAGNSLGQAGQTAAAIDRFAYLAQAARDRCGPDHSDTFAARRFLAEWQGESGNPAAAVRALTDLRADQERVLGPDHRDTLLTRTRSVRWRGVAGDTLGAVTDAKELLSDQRRLLGPDHPDTLDTQNHLAWWRGSSGDPAGAAVAFAQLVTDRERVLGTEDIASLSARVHLGLWQRVAGDPAASVAALTELLADQQRVLGPEHPQVLVNRVELARCRAAAGDLVGGATALTAALTDQTRVLGPDHPYVLHGRQCLAWWQRRSGDRVGATAALNEVLADQVRALGPDHPHALGTRAMLAWWRGEAGDPAGAAADYAAVLADQVRLLGPDHPTAIIFGNNHAYWLGVAGHTAEAASALRSLSVDSQRLLGSEHPVTITVRDNLSHFSAQPESSAGTDLLTLSLAIEIGACWPMRSSDWPRTASLAPEALDQSQSRPVT